MRPVDVAMGFSIINAGDIRLGLFVKVSFWLFCLSWMEPFLIISCILILHRTLNFPVKFTYSIYHLIFIYYLLSVFVLMKFRDEEIIAYHPHFSMGYFHYTLCDKLLWYFSKGILSTLKITSRIDHTVQAFYGTNSNFGKVNFEIGWQLNNGVFVDNWILKRVVVFSSGERKFFKFYEMHWTCFIIQDF